MSNPKKKAKSQRTPKEYHEEFGKKDIVANYFEGVKLDIKFKNENQKTYYKLLDDFEISICSGIAGCGKTHIALFKALELLKDKSNNIERIYLSKPNVEVGEKLGFLPGTVEEKIYMYMLSFHDVLEDIIGEDLTKTLKFANVIQYLPVQFLRGRTLKNACVIVDECQNLTTNEIKTIITRIGMNTKYILLGDTDQSDKKFIHGEDNGLHDALTRFEKFNKMGKFVFGPNDSVRNPIINDLLKYY